MTEPDTPEPDRTEPAVATPSSGDGSGAGGQHARPATLADQAAAALDVSEDVLVVLEEVIDRLTAVEDFVADARRPGAGSETRADFRFEHYAAADAADVDSDVDSEHARQIERARAAWERLDDWVTWLTGTYRLTSVIPPCWADHTAIREELVGLRISWTGAWTPRAGTDAIVIFHEKLWAARARLLDGNWGNPRCTGDHHDTGLDLAEAHQAWTEHPHRSRALITARDRTIATLRAGWSRHGGDR